MLTEWSCWTEKIIFFTSIAGAPKESSTPPVTPIQGPIFLKNGTVPVVPLFSYPTLNNGTFVQIPVSIFTETFIWLDLSRCNYECAMYRKQNIESKFRQINLPHEVTVLLLKLS